MISNYPKQDITGVILAGGRARRMGGEDKGLIRLNGRPMIEFVIEGFAPQVASLMINANRNLERYRQLGNCPVIEDIVDGFAGPLAGMASAMQSAQTPYILTVPCDSPFVAEHLAQRLYTALKRQQARLSVASDGQRMQPVFALLPRDLLTDLQDFLNNGGRKIDRWYLRHKTALADLSSAADSFLNINSREDLLSIEKKIQSKPSC
ncbi:MAG: molybdenum cofactor guanylyltransferase MobA [Pseudomonadota bacterium]